MKNCHLNLIQERYLLFWLICMIKICCDDKFIENFENSLKPNKNGVGY